MDIFESKIKPLIEEQRAAGVDDTEMERKMGLPAHSIYKWMKQGYKSYVKYIPQIASYFHVSVDYLTGASDEKSPPHGDGLSAEQREIMALYDSLSPADRAALIATARALAEARKSQGGP